MSVMCIESITFQSVYITLENIATNNSRLEAPLSSIKYEIREIKSILKLVSKWKKANIKTYNTRYELDENATKFTPNNSGFLLTSYQLLKALESISYNTDVECRLLNKILTNLSFSIVHSLPDYLTAKWG